MFFKRLFQARRQGKTREGSIRVRSQGKHIKDTASRTGDTSRRWGNSARMADCNGNSNVLRIAGDGKSRMVGRYMYTLETNLLRSDLVSPDHRFHSFTPSSITHAPSYHIAVHGIYSRLRYSHPSFNFASSVADLRFFKCALPYQEI